MIVEILLADSLRSACSSPLLSQASDYALKPNVILLVLLDGTARLLDLDGHFCAISATGALILTETLKLGSTTAVNRLVSEYGVQLSQAQEDVERFLKSLETRGVIYSSEGSVPQNKHIISDLSLLLTPMLQCIGTLPLSLKRQAWLILALAYLSTRLFGWSRTITAWKTHRHEVSTHESQQEIDSIVKAVDLAVREAAAHHLLNVECKERALCSWWMAKEAGIPARLTLGVAFFPLTSHCWCEVNSDILADEPERSESCTQFLTYT